MSKSSLDIAQLTRSSFEAIADHTAADIAVTSKLSAVA